MAEVQSAGDCLVKQSDPPGSVTPASPDPVAESQVTLESPDPVAESQVTLESPDVEAESTNAGMEQKTPITLDLAELVAERVSTRVESWIAVAFDSLFAKQRETLAMSVVDLLKQELPMVGQACPSSADVSSWGLQLTPWEQKRASTIGGQALSNNVLKPSPSAHSTGPSVVWQSSIGGEPTPSSSLESSPSLPPVSSVSMWSSHITDTIQAGMSRIQRPQIRLSDRSNAFAPDTSNGIPENENDDVVPPIASTSRKTAREGKTAALRSTVASCYSCKSNRDTTSSNLSQISLNEQTSTSFGQVINSLEGLVGDELLEDFDDEIERGPNLVKRIYSSVSRQLARSSSASEMNLRASTIRGIMQDAEDDDDYDEHVMRNIWSHCTVLLCSCGILPWSFEREEYQPLWQRWSAWYQWLVLMVSTLALATLLYPFLQTHEDEARQYLCYAESCPRLGLLSDFPIVVGGTLGLLSLKAHRNSKDLAESCRLLFSYSFKKEFDKQWAAMARKDLACMLFLWLLAVSERIRGTGMVQAGQDGRLDTWLVLHSVMFALSSLVLLGLAFCMLFVTQALSSAVDAFCLTVVCQSADGNGEHLHEAVPSWNMIQAILRKVSGIIQNCLVVLQATVLFTLLLGAVDVYQSFTEDGSDYVSMLIPASLLTLGVVMIFVKAAAVTDKCARVPSLINSCKFGSDIDTNRQYVVEYVLYSAAGFYVHEIRLTSAMTAKMAYLFGVGMFALSAKIFNLGTE